MNHWPVDQVQSADVPPMATLGGTALPLVGRARVYACGITPYDVTHLGHAATKVTPGRVLRPCQLPRCHAALGDPGRGCPS